MIDNDLCINLNELHLEWERQPSLYMKYSRLAADALRERDKAKECVEILRSECDKEIRTSPEKFDCPMDKNNAPKITEAWVTATINGHIKMMEANNKYHNLNHEYNILSGMVKALDHKKKALEMEVMLWQNSYYAAPVSINKQDKSASNTSDVVRQQMSRKRG